MQNLSQNELNQIAEMGGQLRDELERTVKIRRIKNYEEMSKEELILSLLKSKQRTPKNIERKLKKTFVKQKIRQIFHKQKKEKMMNILENQ